MGRQSENDEVQELLDINKNQRNFYNTSHKERRQKHNLAQKLWYVSRHQMYHVLNEGSLWDDIYNIHRQWFGSLEDKRILDFGCYSGNALSLELASQAKYYLGIDLSEQAISELRDRFDKNGLQHANLKVTDFMSDEFTEDNFDIVYAQGVLHHFRHIEPMLMRLADKLAPNGIVVSCDPLQTALTSKLARAAYRPFQHNREWEWPFDYKTFSYIEKYFTIEQIQGFMGMAKWSLPVAVFNSGLGIRLAKKLHHIDMNKANNKNHHLWRCLQVIMLLRKK